MEYKLIEQFVDLVMDSYYQKQDDNNSISKNMLSTGDEERKIIIGFPDSHHMPHKDPRFTTDNDDRMMDDHYYDLIFQEIETAISKNEDIYTQRIQSNDSKYQYWRAAITSDSFDCIDDEYGNYLSILYLRSISFVKDPEEYNESKIFLMGRRDSDFLIQIQSNWYQILVDGEAYTNSHIFNSFNRMIEYLPQDPENITEYTVRDFGHPENLPKNVLKILTDNGYSIKDIFKALNNRKKEN